MVGTKGEVLLQSCISSINLIRELKLMPPPIYSDMWFKAWFTLVIVSAIFLLRMSFNKYKLPNGDSVCCEKSKFSLWSLGLGFLVHKKTFLS